MTAISRREPAMLHVLLQVGLVDVLGQPVGNVILPMVIGDGQLLLVHPVMIRQLSYFSTCRTLPRRLLDAMLVAALESVFT